MKKLMSLPVLLGTLCTSCFQTRPLPTVEFKSVEDGKLIESTIDAEYDEIMSGMNPRILCTFIHVCSSCTNAKIELQRYAQDNHINIYYIYVDGAFSGEEIRKLVEISTYGDPSEQYKINPAHIDVPTLYLFRSDILFLAFNDAFTSNLNRFVKVVD